MKRISMLLIAVLILSAFTTGAWGAEPGLADQAEDHLHASIQHETDSPAWVASARAGNVIGGGDWAKDRIVPDAMRALSEKAAIPVRNKVSTRPWQHVLEPLGGYLTLGAALATRERFGDYAGGFNFGPDPKANRTVKELVEEMLKHCKGKWVDKSDPNAVHEAGLLNLDIRKARRILGWKPRWRFEKTVEETVKWYESVRNGESPMSVTQRQIVEYGF